MPQMFPMNWFSLFVFFLLCAYAMVCVVNTLLIVHYPHSMLSFNQFNVKWTW